MKFNILKSIALGAVCACSISAAAACGENGKAIEAKPSTPVPADSVATVYYIKDITPENLIKIYKALGVNPQGKVAVKISTGESMKSNQLSPELIAPLVQSLNGTLVECNTAYAGNRNTTEAHLKAVKDHGYTAIAPVDIMDAEGEIELPVDGKHLKKDIVGKDLANYDYVLVLSHFKGHAMGGFGGALKNISIGIASSDGKAYIHSAGACDDAEKIWKNIADQDAFLESMADAARAVTNFTGDNIAYINVANNLSVDCDCNGNPATPKMANLGILASLDPVALDRACVDMVFNSTDAGKGDLIERINSRHGTHILPSAEALGVGTQKYRIVTLE